MAMGPVYLNGPLHTKHTTLITKSKSNCKQCLERQIELKWSAKLKNIHDEKGEETSVL